MEEAQLINTFWLPFIVIFPFLGGPLYHLAGIINSKLKKYTAALIPGISFVLIMSLYPILESGKPFFEIKGIIDYGLTFYLDEMGFLFALLLSLLWFLAMVYSFGYMEEKDQKDRYYLFMLMTFGGSIGTVLTGDLFSLFIFFEIMSISSYVLIVHREDETALRAGKKYLFMAIVGGLFLLMGIFMVLHQTGTLSFIPLASAFSELGIEVYIGGLFLIIGFGVKAGMVPLHIWLPEAHPVAPTPASALLSGIMIKLGVYGLIRTIHLIYTPEIGISNVFWGFTTAGGTLLLILGPITMFIGAFLAIFQKNMKRILAYSSISQVGYILVGLGVAAFLPLKESGAIEGSFYHIMSHALYKSALFMIVGYIYHKTHELDIFRLNKLYNKFPVTMILFIIGMGGITGTPGFNGFVSKKILGKALTKTTGYHFLTGWAELVFTITSVLTVVYFLRLFFNLFLKSGEIETEGENFDFSSLSMIIPSAILVGLVFISGIFPELFYNNLIQPALNVLNVEGGIALEEFHLYDIANIKKALFTLLQGSIVYFLLFITGFERLQFTGSFSLERLFYKPVYRMFYSLSEVFVFIFDKKVDSMQNKTPSILYFLSKKFIVNFDSRVEEMQNKLSTIIQTISEWINSVFDKNFSKVEKKDNNQSKFYNWNKQRVKTFKLFMRRFKFRSEFNEIWIDVKNLDFDLFIVVFILFVFLFFGV